MGFSRTGGLPPTARPPVGDGLLRRGDAPLQHPLTASLPSVTSMASVLVAARAVTARLIGMRIFGEPPQIADIERMARSAWARLPADFARHLTGILLMVEDFADEELLAAMEIDDPFELTGVYEGVPLTERSIDQSGQLPDRIRLFRRPILDEWAARGDETLEHLVSHVLIHEIGHHFGLSDEDMHALEDAVE